MRVRTTTTGGFSQENKLETRSRECGGAYGLWSPVVTTMTGTKSIKTIRDVNTPGFHALLKCGRYLPVKPVSIVTDVETRYPCPSYRNNRFGLSCPAEPPITQYQGSWTWDPYSWALAVPEVNSSVVQAVVNGAAANAREAAWDSLTFLAELSKTKALLRESVPRVRSVAELAIDDYRKKWRGLKRNLRTPTKSRELLSNSWLEYRYGWMPIVYDVESAMKAISSQRRRWNVGRSGQNIGNSDRRITVTPTSQIDWTLDERLTYSHSVRGWASSEFQFQHQYGFDPIVTAYELIPWSFVFDFFTQAGTWLEAVSPFAPGRLIDTMASIKTEIHRELWVSSFSKTNTGSYGDGQMDPFLMRSVHIEKYDRFPHDVGLPGWNPRINLQRSFDLFALITGTKRDLLRRLRI